MRFIFVEGAELLVSFEMTVKSWGEVLQKIAMSDLIKRHVHIESTAKFHFHFYLQNYFTPPIRYHLFPLLIADRDYELSRSFSRLINEKAIQPFAGKIIAMSFPLSVAHDR